jgi:hypothetical protein
MGNLSLLRLGTLAGLHGALYGAYKDSPHESFLFRRFVRESHRRCRALSRCRLLYRRWVVSRHSPSTGAVRPDPDRHGILEALSPLRATGRDRIPTQMHCVVGVVQNLVIRFLFGIGFLASIYGCDAAFRSIPGCSHPNWQPPCGLSLPVSLPPLSALSALVERGADTAGRCRSANLSR